MTAPYFRVSRATPTSYHVILVDGLRQKIVSTHGSKERAIRAASCMTDDANKGRN